MQAVQLSNGRYVPGTGLYKLYRCYMKRQQYSGVTSGSKKIPLESQLDGRMLPGGSGDQFFYRGYALQEATIESDYNWLGDNEGLNWTDMTSHAEALCTGSQVLFKFGVEEVMNATIERSTGQFGGGQIDTTIYAGIGGIELQLTATELQN